MSEERNPQVFLCNGAPCSRARTKGDVKRLEYSEKASTEQNIRLLLPNFVRSVFHLSDRVLDLMEIAAYVFSGDRMIHRGDKSSLEFQSWSRSMHFVIKVRDIDFWKQPPVAEALSEALQFMTGDREWSFKFVGGHKTPQTNLFDNKDCLIEADDRMAVALFSGGLDSLAGILQLLKRDGKTVCLASHQSQNGIIRTQRQIAAALQQRHPDRVYHYEYKCQLKGGRGRDENQRSRAFLYTSIAYAICHALRLDEFFVFENGITAINLPKREDMANARASRTTHPRALALLAKLFSLIEEREIVIHTPFIWKTKTDIFRLLNELGAADLIPSSVSCNRTFKEGQYTHCGGCSQCVDRRFAAYSAGFGENDDCGLYAHDFIKNKITEGETRTRVVDYIRQAGDFAKVSVDYFAQQWLADLAYLEDDAFPDLTDYELIKHVYDLCKRHGEQVQQAMHNMRAKEDVFGRTAEGSVFDIISKREYLQEPVKLLVNDITELLDEAIPEMFHTNKPKNEPDFGEKVSGLLKGHNQKFEREHPYVRFACGHAKPDLSTTGPDLWIELKFIREGTPPSKASAGISEDLTKYDGTYVLFVVYDPTRQIHDRRKFRDAFESKHPCTVHIIS